MLVQPLVFQFVLLRAYICVLVQVVVKGLKKTNFHCLLYGDFLITSKKTSIYPIAKTLRIPLRSLVAINLFSDAVQLSKASGSRPLIFKVDNSPYAANLLSHLMS